MKQPQGMKETSITHTPEMLEEHPKIERISLENGLKIVLLPNDYPRDRVYAYLEVKVCYYTFKILMSSISWML